MKLKIFFIILTLLFSTSSASLMAQKSKKAKAKTSKTSTAKSKKTASKKEDKKASKKNKNSKASKKSKGKHREEEEATVTETKITVTDSTVKGNVVITSAYKPVLRQAAKLNYTATPAINDTAKFALSYNIPAQNLFFSYQPVPIKPIAISLDSTINWQNSKYIKLGYGNFNTPYAEVGASFGHPNKNLYNAYAHYTSSKGNNRMQEFAKANVRLQAQSQLNNHNWYNSLNYNFSKQYQYGVNPYQTVTTTDSFLQQFNSVVFNSKFTNIKSNEYGFSYAPEIKVGLWFSHQNGNEQQYAINLPLEKSLSKIFSIQVNTLADVSTAHFENNILKNNLFWVNPSLHFVTPNFKLHLGVTPSWDNQIFSVLPNLYAESKIADDKLSIIAGYEGYFQKNTLNSLTSINPYLVTPNSLNNTKIVDLYGGFRINVNSHITALAKAVLNNNYFLPLYVNDTTTYQTHKMQVLYEPQATAVQLKGELTYTLQQKFTLSSGVVFTQFAKLATYDKAYGYLPLQLNASLRYKLLKDVHLTSDLFFFGASPYRTKTMQSDRLAPALDLNAGVECTIFNKVNAWLQGKNILNNTYQRWNGYTVLGFQILGGLKYNF